MDGSPHHQWCVLVCNPDFTVSQILSTNNLSLPIQVGDHLSSLVDPQDLNRYFTFAMNLKDRHAAFFHEILIQNNVQASLMLDFSGVRYQDVLIITATSREQDLTEELTAINQELTNALLSHTRGTGDTSPTSHWDGITLINNDLINMKRELLQKNAEISRLLTEQEALNNQLETTIRSKDLLSSILAHDLRSPLSSILNLMSLVSLDEESYQEAVQEGIFETIYDTTSRTITLLEDLLYWYRHSHDQSLVEKETIDMQQLMDEVATLFESDAHQKNIRFHRENLHPIHVQGDSKMVASVLRNLISNALKYTPAGGTILLETRTQDSHCQTRITDTGIGMAPHKAENLFRSSSGDSTPSLAGESGSGVGLILSRELVHLNGGTIDAKSQPGEGTTISFTLPLAP